MVCGIHSYRKLGCKVFAQEDGKTAVAKLWQEIFATVRIDEEHNPVEAWQHHIAFLQRACKFMNEQKFTALKYSNSLGTKLTVGLPEGHIWLVVRNCW